MHICLEQAGPFSGAAEDTNVSKKPHKTESLAPAMGLETGSAGDEEAKRQGRKQDRGTRVVVRCGRDGQLPTQHLSSDSYFVTESQISSWDHGY